MAQVKYLVQVGTVENKATKKTITFYQGKSKYRYNGKTLMVVKRGAKGNVYKQYFLGIDKLPKTLEKLVEEMEIVRFNLHENANILVDWNTNEHLWKNGNPYNLPF